MTPAVLVCISVRSEGKGSAHELYLCWNLCHIPCLILLTLFRHSLEC